MCISCFVFFLLNFCRAVAYHRIKCVINCVYAIAHTQCRLLQENTENAFKRNFFRNLSQSKWLIIKSRWRNNEATKYSDELTEKEWTKVSRSPNALGILFWYCVELISVLYDRSGGKGIHASTLKVNKIGARRLIEITFREESINLVHCGIIRNWSHF